MCEQIWWQHDKKHYSLWWMDDKYQLLLFQTRLNNIKTKMLIQKRLRNTEDCVTVAAKACLALPNLIGELKLKMMDAAVKWCRIAVQTISNLSSIKCFLLQNVPDPARVPAIHLNTRQDPELSPGQKKTESKSTAARWQRDKTEIWFSFHCQF